MDESSSEPRENRVPLIATIVGVVLVGGVVAGVLAANSNVSAPTGDPTTSVQPTETASTPDPSPSTEGATVQPTPSFGSVLPETMGGEEAIEALGDRIAVVAQRNGKTVDELTELLRRDASAKIAPNGFIVYLDDFGTEG